MRFSILALAVMGLVACSSSRERGQKQSAAPSPTMAPSSATKARPGKSAVKPDSVAYFAGGCFWGVEHYLEMLDGVASVESGYMGGHVERPSYEQVTGKKTGHVETVRVRYDSKRIDYRAIAKRFFEIHDPTQANGQGPDIGPQYLSVVFFGNDSEKRAAQELITALKARGFAVVTKLEKAATFWLAEDYHQDYYVRANKKPYCHARVRRFDQPIKR